MNPFLQQYNKLNLYNNMSVFKRNKTKSFKTGLECTVFLSLFCEI